MMKAYFAFLFGGAVFGGFAALIFFVWIYPTFVIRKILKNGVETTATVIDIDSNMKNTTNGRTTKLYYIRLSFVNPAGEQIRYNTPSVYTREALKNVRVKDVIPVKCLAKKAIPVYLVANRLEGWLWMIFILFGVIGIWMLATPAVGAVRHAGIKRYGTDGTGIYVKHVQGGVVFMGQKYYVVHFSFQNNEEIEIEARTGADYFDFEAEALAAMKTFPVKYKGNRAIIMIDKQELKEK